MSTKLSAIIITAKILNTPDNKVNNAHEKIMHFWLAENKCILMQHTCKL